LGANTAATMQLLPMTPVVKLLPLSVPPQLLLTVEEA
jgi:hypothetical protein